MLPMHQATLKRALKKTGLLLSATLLLLGFGVSAQAQTFGNFAAFSQSEEIKIRDELLQQVTQRGGTLNDPVLSVYLDNLGDSLAGANVGSIPFRYFWIEDYTVNAMAMPGSMIGINSGLFLATDNESELAGVLAHELAHVQKRHIARRFERQALTQGGNTAVMVAAAALAALTGAPGQALMAGVMGSQAQATIDQTRSFENEADDAAIKTLRSRGFDVRGFGTFMLKLSQRDLGLGGIPAFLSSHPMPLDRAANIANQPKSGRISSQDYELAKIRTIGLTNLRCHEQINSSGYQYPLSSTYANYWRNRCASGSARGIDSLANNHWITASDYAQYLQESNQGAALKSFASNALAKWPNNEAIATYYLKGANAMQWSISELDGRIVEALDNGRIQSSNIYRDYAVVAARSGDAARSKAAYGFQAMNAGRAFDAVNNFREAMSAASNIGSAKSAWILAIKDIHEAYGF